MKVYNYACRRDCEHEPNMCDYPCQLYYDEKPIENESKNSSGFNKEVQNMNNYSDIENFLRFSVDEPEYAQILNHLKDPRSIIDIDELVYYMKKQNEKYCQKNNLCEVCHAPLKKYESYEEIWGSKQLAEIYYSCPNGC